MGTEISIDAVAEMPLLEVVQAQIDAFADDHGWSEESRFQVSLALEEVLTNVISYGADGQAQPLRAHVRLRQEAGEVWVGIADDGVAFDPLQAPPPDLESGLDERRVGGLGVFLVQQLMDSVTYRRDGAWNRLELRKRTA